MKHIKSIKTWLLFLWLSVKTITYNQLRELQWIDSITGDEEKMDSEPILRSEFCPIYRSWSDNNVYWYEYADGAFKDFSIQGSGVC